MMDIQKFLDTKHANVLGRVYFLILLFIGNALIPIGAVMKFMYKSSTVIMYVGIAITVFAIAILSTPCNLKQFTSSEK